MILAFCNATQIRDRMLSYPLCAESIAFNEKSSVARRLATASVIVMAVDYTKKSRGVNEVTPMPEVYTFIYKDSRGQEELRKSVGYPGRRWRGRVLTGR